MKFIVTQKEFRSHHHLDKELILEGELVEECICKYNRSLCHHDKEWEPILQNELKEAESHPQIEEKKRFDCPFNHKPQQIEEIDYDDYKNGGHGFYEMSVVINEIIRHLNRLH